MNLEFDDDEVAVLDAAADTLGRVAPVPVSATRGMRPDRWNAVVGAGWSEIGAGVEAGDIDLAVAAAIYRRAGALLLIEDFVTSGYLLNALAYHADGNGRAAIEAALRARRGVLLGDGRAEAVPVVAPGTSHGYCFGATGAVDAYRLVGAGGGFVLQRAIDPPVRVAPVGEAGLAVAGVSVDPGARWESWPVDVGPHLARLRTDVLLIHSAALVGCAEQIILSTRDFVAQRIQFGVPIGSFQAVKHRLADAHTAATIAWNAVLGAVARGADRELAPLAARLLTVDAAMIAARAGAQLHGGVGFTAELPLQLYLRSMLDGVQRFGSPDEIAIRLGQTFVRQA
ncbi:acyl-CoA dehydrogenase family protein [Dactylosporangium sp. CA-092794]|uniref:acyl-CoA dehydrogenase family protein n=1 Tax=Dactylosporangium sp. CA-092794 TaxID=3239929 RepID=UPI003D8FD659